MRSLLPSVLVLAWALPAAALDDTVVQEGVVYDANGRPFEGEHNVRVRFWDREAGGNPVFDELHRDVPFVTGWYAIAVGSERDIDPAVFTLPRLWLTIAVYVGAVCALWVETALSRRQTRSERPGDRSIRGDAD